MSTITSSDYIRCCFESNHLIAQQVFSGELELFYAQTRNLSSEFLNLKKYLTRDERLRADKFHFKKDKETYISCHTLLRLILANRLNKNPSEISFIKGKYNRPGLIGNPLYFNITHTREAFAFAITRHPYIGIDLEKVNQNVDFNSIAKECFSKKEREYIFESQTEARNRFFLLWTRKEALLKAIGTGIINDLTQIEVSERENYIKKTSFDNLVSGSAFNDYFIYSKKLLNYYLSIAIPKKAEIILNQINKENIYYYLD